MFSFFKKKRNRDNNTNNNKERTNSSNSEEINVQSKKLGDGEQFKKSVSLKTSQASTVKTQSTQSSNSSSSTQSPSIPHLSQTNQTPSPQQSVNKRVFIEYTIQNEETLDDICEKFNMDKIFLMEINQIWTDDDIPSVIIVQATPIQQNIIMNHAIKDETIQIIEKNNNNYLSDNLNTTCSNDQKETEDENKKIAFFASLEKNEEFPMRLITANGVIRGLLTINSFMVHFSPETKDYKRLQNEIDILKKKKANRHLKFENNQLTDYSVTLDINDIFMADINVRDEQLPELNTTQSKKNKEEQDGESMPQISTPNKMEIKLDIFMSRVAGINSDIPRKQFMKVEFVSSETFESDDPNDNENIGRTYVHYVLQKLQYLIGKNRSNNEAIEQFTEDFTQQPSQSIVKHFQHLSCESLHLMNLNTDTLFSSEVNTPPKLEIYPSMRDGNNLIRRSSKHCSTQADSDTLETETGFDSVLNQSQFEQIVERLPCYLQLNDWNLVYSPIKHGFSYETMIKKCHNIGPHMIIIKDAKHKYIFGAFVTEGWQKKPTSYGSGESFLFSFKKNPENYQRKYQKILLYSNRTGSTHMQHCNDTGIAIGIDTKFALFIHHSLSKGTTHSTRLMSNDPLTESSDFKIDSIEIWGLDPTLIPKKVERKVFF